MTVRELGHLVLYVRDVGAPPPSTATCWAGSQILPEPGTDPVGAAAFSSGRTHHELLLIEVGADATPIPTGRPGRAVPLRAQGGRHRRRPARALATVQATGATVVGTSDHTVTHSLYILDPDGNEIELYVDVPGVDWKSEPSLIGAAIRPLSL